MTHRPYVNLMVTFLLVPILLVGMCIGYVIGETVANRVVNCSITIHSQDEVYGKPHPELYKPKMGF